MTDIQSLAILGVIGLFGNTIAVIVQAIMNAHYSKISLEVTKSTHKIVNNQRTQMLRFIAALSTRIALDNPNDEAAGIAAKRAEEDANRAFDAEK